MSSEGRLSLYLRHFVQKINTVGFISTSFLSVNVPSFNSFFIKLSSRLLGHPLFFLRLASSNRPKFLVFSKQKKYDVVKPFFTKNSSFKLKNEHSNSIEKDRNKNRNVFYSILCFFVNPIMWILTFNVILGYQGLLFRDSLWFFFFTIFFSNPTDRPTQHQETHSTLNEKKKRDGLSLRLTVLDFLIGLWVEGWIWLCSIESSVFFFFA